MLVVLRDAWTTVVPDREDRHGPLPPVMLALTVVTGLVDAFSYLVLGHVFVANMTGNVVFSGFAIAGAAGFSLAASLAALAAFAVGALLGGRIAHRTRAHRGQLLHMALILESVLVLAAYAVAQSTGSPYDGDARYALIALLGLGMGVQNAASRALAVPDLTTTVLTLTITGIASDSRAAGGKGGKVGRRTLSALAMFIGGLVGAVAVLHGNPALPLLLASLLLLGATAATHVLARSDAPWTDPL
ncbi:MULTISPECIES: YoaK family protein [Streptacidiphilus]|uniref:YoaK family protein n=1 Tax=Streptacidiphilus cavernicola TaxID=3342716 RepID=A0ABV6UKR0_9ACTN|nr:YoaK family protein [Streptacidiphilus jeojiense]